MVGDEGGAVEALPRRAVRARLGADTVGGDHRDDVGHRMALHDAAPGVAGVQAGVVGLAADGGGIEQHLGPHQGHGARGLRIPLVPADARADPAVAGLPDLEAGVARTEVVLLLIARPVGDVALAVDAEQGPVRVRHHQAVVVVRPLALVNGDGDHHAEFGRERGQGGDAGMLAPGVGGGEPALLLGHAEIGALEQFRGQDDLGPLRRRLAHQIRGGGDVVGHVQAVRRLNRAERERAGHQAGSCWLMQWKLPPPVSRAREDSPITSRSGNMAARASSARGLARAS